MENIRQTKAVVDLAHLVGVSVEGEVGTIGIMNYSDEGGVDHIIYTRPEEVIDFTAKTGVDSLAVAIGTSHGLYPEGFVPKLQLDLLKELKQVSPVPLVLHGGSDNPDEEIRQACPDRYPQGQHCQRLRGSLFTETERTHEWNRRIQVLNLDAEGF